MRKRFWEEDRGFTLIEIVITIVVLALISIPMLAYFSDAMKHTARTKEQQNAVVAAQNIVEELKDADYSLDADKVSDIKAAPAKGWTVASSPAPTSASASYEMYTSRSINGKSYNVVAKVTPKKSVDNVYNSATGAYDATLDYSEAIIPSMDSTKDVISTETSKHLSDATIRFLSLYSNYCRKKNVAQDESKVNDAIIRDHLKRNIKISIEQAVTAGEVLVTVSYEYSYVKDATDEYPQDILNDYPDPYVVDVASSSIDATKLENIFVFYNPDNAGDSIQVTSSKALALLGIADVNLYIIAENSVASANATPEDNADPNIQVRNISYRMKANIDWGIADAITKVFTNLSNKSADEMDGSGNLYGKLQKDASGAYTLITKGTYNRLVDITVDIYKDQGGTYPFSETDKLAEVNSNKVQ